MSFMRVAAALGAAVLLALTGCASPPALPSPPAPSATQAAVGWERIADFPLEPRDSPAAVWTGTELLVFGGYAGPPCLPNADCTMGRWAADGAALDPASGSWRRIADMPTTHGYLAGAAAAGGFAYLNISTETTSAVLVYSVADDTWERLDGVPDLRGMRIVADGDRLLFVSDTDELDDHYGGPCPDQVFSPDTATWAPLPDDPFPASFSRYAVSTPYGVVLSGVPIEDVDDAAPGFENLALLPP